MARIIYDDVQPTRYYNNDQLISSGSAGYYRPRSNSSIALVAIVILLMLFFWADLPGLRGNLDPELRDNLNSIISPMTGTRYVTADNLNLREQPGTDAQARYILPRGTQVVLLGESQYGLDGDVWLRVRVETIEGAYVGWVSQRYVE